MEIEGVERVHKNIYVTDDTHRRSSKGIPQRTKTNTSSGAQKTDCSGTSIQENLKEWIMMSSKST